MNTKQLQIIDYKLKLKQQYYYHQNSKTLSTNMKPQVIIKVSLHKVVSMQVLLVALILSCVQVLAVSIEGDIVAKRLPISDLNKPTIASITAKTLNSTTTTTTVPTITTTATFTTSPTTTAASSSTTPTRIIETTPKTKETSDATLTTTIANLKSAADELDNSAANDDDDLELLTANDDKRRDEDTSELKSLVTNTASAAVDTLTRRLMPVTVSSNQDSSILTNDDNSNNDENADNDNNNNNEDSEETTTTLPTASSLQLQATASLTPSSTSTNHLINVKQTNRNKELNIALDAYAKWRSTSDELVDLLSRKLLPLVMRHSYDIDGETLTGIVQLFNGIRGLQPWAMKLLDASAKLTPGLLLGTQSDFGDFDECLAISANLNSDQQQTQSSNQQEDNFIDVNSINTLKQGQLIGKYCLADVEFAKPPRELKAQGSTSLHKQFEPIELRKPLYNFSLNDAYKETIFAETANFFHMLYVDPIRVGVCITHKMSTDSLELVVNKLLAEFKVSISFNNRCVTRLDLPLESSINFSTLFAKMTRYQQVSTCILLTVCLFVLLSTICELICNKFKKLPLGISTKTRLKAYKFLTINRDLLTSFSLIRNTKRLMHISSPTTTTTKLAKELASKSNYKQNLTLTNTSIINDNNNNNDCKLISSPMILRKTSTTSTSLDNSIRQSSDVSLINSSSSSSSACSMSSSMSTSSLSSSTLPVASNVDLQQNNCTNFDCALTCKQQQQQQQQLKANSQDIDLRALHGVRVLTMTWMIVNHTYLFGGFFVLWAHRRLISIAEWPKSVSFQLVLNGWLTVETYFFLSALIVVLGVWPQFRARTFSYPAYLLHRLLRLLPAYIGLIALNFVWPLASSGPVWLVKGQEFIQAPCESHLWANLLFVNNWLWPEKMCMVHTWFLSADFQLYACAPLLVYALYKKPNLGHSLNFALAVVAAIISGLVIYTNKLMPSTLINKLEFDAIKQQLSYAYFATYQHLSPYCLGLFVGYLLVKRPRVALPAHLTASLWLLLPPLSLATLLLTYLWNGAFSSPDLTSPSPIISAVYVSMHRAIWTSLVAWIVFACATHRAKLLSSFLSNGGFVVLSRLSFSIYLTHLPVIMYRALNVRHTLEWTDANFLWQACGNFAISTLIAYFLNVAFESPAVNLQKALFSSPRSQSLQSKNRTKQATLASASSSPTTSLKASNDQVDSSSSPSSSSSSSPLSTRLSINAINENLSLSPTTNKSSSIIQQTSMQTTDTASGSLSVAPTNSINLTTTSKQQLNFKPPAKLTRQRFVSDNLRDTNIINEWQLQTANETSSKYTRRSLAMQPTTFTTLSNGHTFQQQQQQHHQLHPQYQQHLQQYNYRQMQFQQRQQLQQQYATLARAKPTALNTATKYNTLDLSANRRWLTNDCHNDEWLDARIFGCMIPRVHQNQKSATRQQQQKQLQLQQQMQQQQLPINSTIEQSISENEIEENDDEVSSDEFRSNSNNSSSSSDGSNNRRH